MTTTYALFGDLRSSLAAHDAKQTLQTLWTFQDGYPDRFEAQVHPYLKDHFKVPQSSDLKPTLKDLRVPGLHEPNLPMRDHYKACSALRGATEDLAYLGDTHKALLFGMRITEQYFEGVFTRPNLHGYLEMARKDVMDSHGAWDLLLTMLGYSGYLSLISTAAFPDPWGDFVYALEGTCVEQSLTRSLKEGTEFEEGLYAPLRAAMIAAGLEAFQLQMEENLLK